MIDHLNVASVFALGWIPYYKSVKKIPHNAYREYASGGRRKRTAIDMLFYSGNDKPPTDIFGSAGRFKEYLHKKDFRGALMLYDIKLYRDANNRYDAVFRSLAPDEHVGYTPIRFPFFLRSKRLSHYSKGRAIISMPSRILTDDGVIISYEVQFQIGRVANVVGKLLTSYWAPIVWMRVDYDIKYDGQSRVALSGTFVPSQVYFSVGAAQKYRQLYYHDMEGIDLEQALTVLEADSPKAEGERYCVIESESWR